jgi:hypothetical protein
LDGKQCPSLVGLGHLETLGRLLDIEVHLAGDLLEDIAHLTASMNVSAGHDKAQQSRGKQKPSAKAWDRKRHRVQFT